MRINVKDKRKKIINALINSNNKKYKGDFIRLFIENLFEGKKKGKNVIQKK